MEESKKTSLVIQEPLENILAWLETKAFDNFIISFEPLEAEKHRVQLYDPQFGHRKLANLGALSLSSLSPESTEIVAPQPSFPSEQDVLFWAYPQLIEMEMKVHLFSNPERVLVRAASMQRLFIGGAYYEDHVLLFFDQYAFEMEASNILKSVALEDLIRPGQIRKTSEGDTWETLAKEFYRDEKYASHLRDAMAEYGIHTLKPGIYLPVGSLLKTPHPTYPIRQINEALDHFKQMMGPLEDEQWYAVAAFFGLQKERVLELLFQLYQLAYSLMEEPQGRLAPFHEELKAERQKAQDQILAAMKAAFK